MERVQGQSLRSIIKGRRHCPVEHVQLAIEAIRGVSALHAVGLTHGDVRPVNILIIGGNSVKLIDYGVRYPAALCKPSTPKSRTYTGYMALEVWLGSEPSLSSDVYGLGVLTYHLLTGYKLRKDPQQRNVTPLSLCKSVSAEVEELVLKALSLKPEVRPSAIAMLACLDSTPRFT